MAESTYSKILVLLTLFIFITGIGAFLTAKGDHQSTSVTVITTKDQPSLGYRKAPVHLIVFEEPKCPECKQFTRIVYPLIKKEFIETNKVQYTVIPVSFMPDSIDAAVAWLCVFNQQKSYGDRELVFSYINYMYMHQPSESENWVNEEILLKFARKANSQIDPLALKNCLKKATYRAQIEKNTDYGMDLMNGDLGTPTIYINGIKAEKMDYKSLKQLINKALQHKGIKS